MEWVLSFVLIWWAVVAVIMFTAILLAGTKKPETRSVPENQPSHHLPLQVKKF